MYTTTENGDFGEISDEKHRIQETKVVASIHFHPYRARPRIRQLEKENVDKMPKELVAEPITTEWLSRIVFVMGKDTRLQL